MRSATPPALSVCVCRPIRLIWPINHRDLASSHHWQSAQSSALRRTTVERQGQRQTETETEHTRTLLVLIRRQKKTARLGTSISTSTSISISTSISTSSSLCQHRRQQLLSAHTYSIFGSFRVHTNIINNDYHQWWKCTRKKWKTKRRSSFSSSFNRSCQQKKCKQKTGITRAGTI